MSPPKKNGKNNKRTKTGEIKSAQPPLGKIPLDYVVRLRFRGDFAERKAVNTNLATHIWKTEVCKEIFKKDGSWDLDRYKKLIKKRLHEEYEKIYKNNTNKIEELKNLDPIFVRAAVHVAKKDECFEDDHIVCTDHLGNVYYKVKDSVILYDLKEPRQSGQTRKQEREGLVSFLPTLTGPLCNRDLPTLEIHDRLRGETQDSQTVVACIKVYNTSSFQECIKLLRCVQEEYAQACSREDDMHEVENDDNDLEESEEDNGVDLFEECAKHWALAVKDPTKDWAMVVEECRKTISLLLWRVCDLWNWKNLEDPKKAEDNQVIDSFQRKRVHQILWYLLPLDKANSLYHMLLDRQATKKVRGLCWYSKYDDYENGARDIAEMPKNTHKPSLNKRYMWLCRYFYTQGEEAKVISKWLEIAFPQRLGAQDHMKTKVLKQQLQQARDIGWNAAVAKARQDREEALIIEAKERIEAEPLKTQRREAERAEAQRREAELAEIQRLEAKNRRFQIERLEAENRRLQNQLREAECLSRPGKLPPGFVVAEELDNLGMAISTIGDSAAELDNFSMDISMIGDSVADMDSIASMGDNADGSNDDNYGPLRAHMRRLDVGVANLGDRLPRGAAA